MYDTGWRKSEVIHYGPTKRTTCSSNFAKTETLMIKPFGSEGGRITTCDVVQVGVKTKRGTYLELQLLVVPLICEPLTGQPMTYARERYSHLNGLELTDCGALMMPLRSAC